MKPKPATLARFLSVWENMLNSWSIERVNPAEGHVLLVVYERPADPAFLFYISLCISKCILRGTQRNSPDSIGLGNGGCATFGQWSSFVSMKFQKTNPPRTKNF